jgi:GNAT superfamily N-acetyltransferase
MPLIVESCRSSLPDAAKANLARVYRDSPEFASGEGAVTALDAMLGDPEAVLYAGVFNGKHICAMLASGPAVRRQLRYLCVHPANRGRGIANRLFEEVRRQEAAAGASYLEAVFNLEQPGVPELLLAVGFIPQGQPEVYRCML